MNINMILIILFEIAAITYVYLLKKDIILHPALRNMLFFIGAAICVLRDFGSVVSFLKMLLTCISDSMYLGKLMLSIGDISIYSLLTYIALRAGFNELNNKYKQINKIIVIVLNVVYLISILLNLIISKYFYVGSIIAAGVIIFLMFKITAELNKLCLKERVICPCCGMYLPSESNVCKKCGNALDVHNLSDSTEDTVICPSCSAENKSGKKFCSKCGNRLI